MVHWHFQDECVWGKLDKHTRGVHLVPERQLCLQILAQQLYLGFSFWWPASKIKPNGSPLTPCQLEIYVTSPGRSQGRRCNLFLPPAT